MITMLVRGLGDHSIVGYNDSSVYYPNSRVQVLVLVNGERNIEREILLEATKISSGRTGTGRFGAGSLS